MKKNNSTFALFITAIFFTLGTSQCMNKELNKKYTSIQSIISNEKLVQSLNEKQLQQFKRRIKTNILHSLRVEKETTTLKDFIKITLKFYSGESIRNKPFGSATCFYDMNNNTVKLHSFFIKEIYRDYGLGTCLFDYVMKEIHFSFPKTTIVYWDAVPLFFEAKNPENNDEEWEEAQERLYKFYKNCGATVDEETSKCYINLKDAGYFNEN